MGTSLDRKLSRRGLVTGAAALAGAAGLGLSGAAAAPKTGRVSGRGIRTGPYLLQDKPFAGQELVVLGPSYHAPYVPETFIAMFEEKTGAKVEWTQMPGDQAEVKYAAFLVAQDNSVDVMYGWETLVAKFGPVLFEDITGKVNQAVMDDLAPAATAAFDWLGKQYGVPFDSNMSIFMWNSELYAAAGLDPETPPQNWAEFIDFGTKLTGGDKYGTTMVPGFFPYAVLINSTGGQALNDDLTQVQADSPESVVALQAIADTFTSGSVDPVSLSLPDSIEQGKNFRAGRFAHYIAFPNHFAHSMDPTQSQIVGKARTGINPGITLRSGTANGIEGYVINRFSENKDLALAFLEHTVSPEIQQFVGLTWGRPPASQSTLDNPEVLEKAPQFASVKEQAQYPAKRYGSPFYADLDRIYTDEILKLAKGEQSVEETAAALQSTAQQTVDDYWAKA